MVDEVYDEKRGFVRMPVDTIVTFTIKGKGDEKYHGTSQNLSASGLYMTTADPVELGDEIELIMNSSDQRYPPFVAEGEVIRCTIDELDKHLYHVSVSLTKTH
jgi:hypothetical protein